MQKLNAQIQALLSQKNIVLIGIDGRCASGKTTLADQLQKIWDAVILHVDDFYLPKTDRTVARMAEPAGHIDRQRILDELLKPLHQGITPVYRPFSCERQAITDSIVLPKKPVYILEGSYSCHPDLKSYYDLTVFVTADSKTQLSRLLVRNPGTYENFLHKWIPLEETYLSTCPVESGCDFSFDTSVSSFPDDQS